MEIVIEMEREREDWDPRRICVWLDLSYGPKKQVGSWRSR